MDKMAAIAALGFLSVFTGSLLGFSAASYSKGMGRRYEGSLAGFTAGLLIAFVCFKILEEGFLAAPLYVGITGILAGVVVAAHIDGIISKRINGGLSGDTLKTSGINTALVTAAGVMIHHFPEGLALGGMYSISPRQGITLAIIISIHCIPEMAAVYIPLRGLKTNVFRIILTAAVLSIPMAAGSVLGVLFKEPSGIFLALSLTFSGGVMLYITCGEMLPDSKRLWNGRLTTVCAMLGFILGVVITV